MTPQEQRGGEPAGGRRACLLLGYMLLAGLLLMGMWFSLYVVVPR